MMRRSSRLAAAMALAFQLAWAQVPSDLTSTLDRFVAQVGDPNVVREIVEDVASLTPESVSRILSSGTPEAALLELASNAGVPELAAAAARDPVATLRALEVIASDPDAALAALDRAGREGSLDGVLAQAPPDVEPDPTEPPPLPGSVPSDTPAAGDAPIDDPAGPAGSNQQNAPALPGSESNDGTERVSQEARLALDVATWLELGFVVVGWIAVTWLLFFVLWRLFLAGNPFLAVRIAYSISVVAALSYLALVFWPREFGAAVDSRYAYVPYVVAGVLALLVIVAIWANYRTESEYD